MSEAATVLAEVRDPPAPTMWSRAWQAVQRRLEAFVERANPILVKETRQALKSRQFLVTFFIVLAACWIISFAGVALVGPSIYYAAAGPQMFLAYYTVLVVPLALIVPFSAYRSLAAEQEENTYDLLSISTLTSKQIITGKLASATVQMLVYLCAVSPCIAFTFLLRGVDAVTILYLLAAAVFGSIGLSMAALLIGAVARAKHMQIVVSVALVIGLFWATIGGIGLGGLVIYDTLLYEQEFWIFMFVLATVYVTTFGLLHAAAAAQLAFPSENRSTPLRLWMMAQQAMFCGWFAGGAYAVIASGGFMRELVAMALTLAAPYWYLMGALLTSEWPHLSRRVQRSLPKSTLGRSFLSLFNPGPGTGYLFAVANLTALVVAAVAVILLVDDRSGRRWLSNETLVYFAILSWAYVVALLGIGRLAINALRKWTFVPMAAGFLLHLIIFLTGVGVPTVIQMTSRQLRYGGYSLVQVTNPLWTLAELLDDGPAAVQAEILVLVLPALAVATFLVNMRSVATELMHHRVAPPTRVAEEEAELHPAPQPGPANPWEAEGDETVSDQRSAFSQKTESHPSSG